MGDAAQAFDADLRAAIAPYAVSGEVNFRARTTLTWGRPRTEPQAR